MTEYRFIDKAVFFPEHGILAVGDLHIGHEQSMRNMGFLVPESQVNEVISDFEKIFEKIKEEKWKLKKIVFLGDLKHSFGYDWKERFYFNKLRNFLLNYVKDKDIVLIKGNHDKFDFSGKKMKNYYFYRGLVFFHGHMGFPQTEEKRVKTWVIGHLHPSVFLTDSQGIKREKYKCFLLGKYKGKEVFVLPSFLGVAEGTPVNDDGYRLEIGFSVIPNKNLKKFRIHAINDNGEILDFGEVRKIMF